MSDEARYFLVRAAEEIKAALRASSPEARLAHLELSDLFLDKLIATKVGCAAQNQLLLDETA